MPLSEPEWDALFRALEAEGWLLQGQQVHAPRRSIWLNRGSWPGSLRQLHERMAARLERIRATASDAVEDADEHASAESDTASLVRALERLLEGRNGG